MSATLYEIADLRGIIDAALEESGGELTPEIEQALNVWNEKFSDKAERVALYICEQDALADAADAEAKRLKDLAASRRRRVESLKRYLMVQMSMVGKDRIDGVLKTIVVAKNPASVRGELSQDELRAWWVPGSNLVRQIPASFKLDKAAVLEAYKAGVDLPAGLTVEQGISLRIK